MNFTNCSAADMFLVFLKTAMLMPATMLVTVFPPDGMGDGSGTGATPMSAAFMPRCLSDPEAACQITMAVFPVAQSTRASVPLEYWASLGLVILSVWMKSIICLTAATFCGVLKVGLPAASKNWPPCCWLSSNAMWMFSATLPPSIDRPQWLLVVSFLPSATSSAQVVGGLLMPAAANSALL